MDNMNRSIEKVTNAVRRAGEYAKDAFRKERIIQNKAGGDLATEIDIEVNNAIISFLRKEFPDDGIISEEADEIKSDSEFVWVIDPIDGSKHYAQGSPHYAISLALQHNGSISMGIVYSPQSDELFTATRNGGAFLNGKEISCGSGDALNRAMLCVEIPSRHAPPPILDAALDKLKKLILNCQRIRIIGVSSLGLCYCACGAFDGYINLGSYPNELWDYAGGEIILQESGGIFTKDKKLTIAGNQQIHDHLMDLLSNGL